MKNINYRELEQFKCCTKEERICYICDCKYEYFLNKANIVGVGLGYRIKKGIVTTETCIKVFASKKVPDNELSPDDLIPPVYGGIKTDVVESGSFKGLSLTDRIRPTLCGYSIGPSAQNYIGTLGCLVTDGHDKFILSNNHVIAGFNSLKIGTSILQPGGDKKEDEIAQLSKFVPIKFIEGRSMPVNYVDCAIAKVTDEANVSPEIESIGIPRGIRGHKLGQLVKKVGATSELTTGIIEDVNITTTINAGSKQFLIKKQILTSAMAKPGDSGAVLLNDNDYVIALLMAGNDDYTIFNPIRRVLNSLDVTIVSK
ncbi:serine protease [Clostridium botulinum]|nr:serine protease [Clostridium botulinum]NFQ89703.1 serine protease [Clostridium botulinum]NFR05097.1 serine protease [Clostridium botulinum]NFU74695.1 serine protease [Clostridium botulinum]